MRAENQLPAGSEVDVLELPIWNLRTIPGSGDQSGTAKVELSGLCR
jgi:hypothetical protein